MDFTEDKKNSYNNNHHKHVNDWLDYACKKFNVRLRMNFDSQGRKKHHGLDN